VIKWISSDASRILEVAAFKTFPDIFYVDPYVTTGCLSINAKTWAGKSCAETVVVVPVIMVL